MSTAHSNPRPVRIGLAGFGNVGAGVYKNLIKNAGLLRERTGCHLQVTKIAVRNLQRNLDFEVPQELFTTDLDSLVNDSNIDVVVELIGGTDAAYDLVCKALRAKKPVVTGNKALLAERGQELFALAEEHHTQIYFEAAVAGGIPIIQTVQEGFVGNHIRSIYGIINGTCNYILTRMKAAGISYQDALNEAQQLGYAEADPTLDVSGWDSAHKAIILASLSYGHWIKPSDVQVTGIEDISAIDINFADKMGYSIKLLSVIRADEDGNVEVRTQPSLLAKDHILASVSGSFNALFVDGDVVGQSLFYGRGAGQDPTSSSVISDLAEAAATLTFGPRHSGFVPHGLYGPCKPICETETRYYVRFTVDDRPGVLGNIATLFGDLGICISSVVQPEDDTDNLAYLVMQLDSAPFSALDEAITQICALDCIRAKPVVLRVEDLEA